MKYPEKERRMYIDLAFFALLAVVLIILNETNYIELLERYIYIAMMAPYLIGRWMSGKFIYKVEEREDEGKVETKSASSSR